MYWAVTTITTVGYGDLIPTSDGERLYTVFAMLIGGALYSCVIGNIFVILNSRNLNAQASIQRLREVHAFLDLHSLPKGLRQRVWRHHREHIKHKNTTDTFNVLEDLSPELRQAVSFVIVHEDVRSHPLFHGLPSIVTLFLATVIKTVHHEYAEIIASYGEYGYSMSVITEGSAVMDTTQEPVTTRDAAIALCENPSASQMLLPGDSFGEEILMGVTRTYAYSVVAVQATRAHIPAEEFLMKLHSMPDIVQKMRSNFDNPLGSSGAEQRGVPEALQRHL
jgi:CRP-like cAMP-binding protein